MAENWTRAYARATGAFPDADPRRQKYWPPVGRIDNVYGIAIWFALARRWTFGATPPLERANGGGAEAPRRFGRFPVLAAPERRAGPKLPPAAARFQAPAGSHARAATALAPPAT